MIGNATELRADTCMLMMHGLKYGISGVRGGEITVLKAGVKLLNRIAHMLIVYTGCVFTSVLHLCSKSSVLCPGFGFPPVFFSLLESPSLCISLRWSRCAVVVMQLLSVFVT